MASSLSVVMDEWPRWAGCSDCLGLILRVLGRRGGKGSLLGCVFDLVHHSFRLCYGSLLFDFVSLSRVS